MSFSTVKPPRQNSKAYVFSTMMLAGWRLSQMWKQLILVELGIIATVMLVCSVPLFSEVARSAGLRNTLDANSGSNAFSAIIQVNQPSSALIINADQKVNHMVNAAFESHISGSPQFSLQTPNLDILLNGRTTSGQSSMEPISSSDQLVLNGYAIPQIKQHITLSLGRLPLKRSRNIEIAITATTAENLGVHIGSIVITRLPSNAGLIEWPLHIVGIFKPIDPGGSLWQGQTFQPQSQMESTLYQALVSNDTLINASTTSSYAPSQPFTLSWSYQLDVSRLDVKNIDMLVSQSQTMEQQIPNALRSLPSIQSAIMSGSLFSILPQYNAQLRAVEVPVTVLLIMIIGLALFFVGMMADVLVERQTATIALLQSRGASFPFIFGMFMTQGIGLGLIALLTGPFATVLLVQLIADMLLPSTDISAITTIATHPVHATLDVGWFALIAVAGSVVLMMLAVYRAVGFDILALRRETSRTRHRPLWQRLNMDVIASILVFGAYAEYTSASQSLGIETETLLGPLSLVAPLLVIVASILLFLRFFPLLLRISTRIASQRRNAPIVLAIAQMERSPRGATRIILLLSLATAFSIFMLTFMASQEQRIVDEATYRVGADFSGKLPFISSEQQVSVEKTSYQNISGVISTTLGYRDSTTSTANDELPVQIVAVDADTFSHTALWTTQDAAESLPSLTAFLAAHRNNVSLDNTVYAVVDKYLWNALHLTVGAPFTLPLPGFSERMIHFIAGAEVQNIPGIYDSPPDGSGILVDYQSYATAYNKATAQPLAPNYIWLRTKSDTASLKNVRTTLNTDPLQLSSLLDRRALISLSEADPLQINLIGVLSIGITFALLLALVGTLVATWLNIFSRLTNFAVLRALGMMPHQIALALLWEQGITYAIALTLGTLLGGLLIAIVVPTLVFTNAISNVSSPMSVDVPVLQIVIPVQQITVLIGILFLICGGVLLFTMRLVSRPSMSQTLRLNED